MCIIEWLYSNDMEIWPTATAQNIISIFFVRALCIWVYVSLLCMSVDFMRLHRNDDDNVNVTGKCTLIKMFSFSKEGERERK